MRSPDLSIPSAKYLTSLDQQIVVIDYLDPEVDECGQSYLAAPSVGLQRHRVAT